MGNNSLIKKKARTFRKIRKIHRSSGLMIFIFVLIFSITGFLLAWKKNTRAFFSTSTLKGSSAQVSEWLPLDSLNTIALVYFSSKYPSMSGSESYKIYVYPDKGSLKYLFNDQYFEVQLDGKTGELLVQKFRGSDLIEDIHDGSIIDNLLGINNNAGKLIYSSLLSVFCFLFAITGFWLYLERRKIKTLGKKNKGK